MENKQVLYLKKLGINTYKEAVIYIRSDCPICRAEGFDAKARIKVSLGDSSVIATLNMIDSEILQPQQASLSNYAWELLQASEGDPIYLSHPKPLKSVGYIRSKIYGNELSKIELLEIVNDMVAGYLSDVHVATFLTACAGGHININEILYLTEAMIKAGNQLKWPASLVVDKHSVGGLPGNRTSLIVVPIVTAFGLIMPKTSSRAITSPSGTADTMEVLAPVELTIKKMQQVVEKENGCIVWGGAMTLSPADDILIRIERAIDLDSEGQLVASILSKKVAAGSTHIVIDIPVGPTAKVRSIAMANILKVYLEKVAHQLGLTLCILFSDGIQPVGRGIGPALEAKDVIAVLTNHSFAPIDLQERALTIAGQVLEFSAKVPAGEGKEIAKKILASGRAWEKFQAICETQGGMREIPTAKYTKIITAELAGKVTAIDNRRLARIAKLAGAPTSKAAGVELLTPLNTQVSLNQPLFVIHADSKGELGYALNYLEQALPLVQITEIE